MLNRKITLLFPLILLCFCACETKKEIDKKDLFKNKVIVLLSKEPDPESDVLSIQDFIENEKAFIPVFTSLDKLTASTQGAELPYPKYTIDGLFLLSILNDSATLRINPTLKDEAYYKSSELKTHFRKDIEALLVKMESEK